MNKGKTMRVIRGEVDVHAALENARAMAAGAPVAAAQSVLYPYFGFRAHCTIPTFVGTRTVSINCLVDGLNDAGATADSYMTDVLYASNEVRLEAIVSQVEAERTARQTMTHGLGRKLKMIAPFDVHLELAGIVYKRFWIVRIGDARIMTDSVTGHMHPLNASAA